MQVIGKLLAAPALQQRNFTGRDGAAQVFNYRTIVLNCGTDSLAGEMMGETAVRWPHQHLLESVALWSADVTLHLRQLQNQNGETKSVTEIRVNRLEPLA